MARLKTARCVLQRGDHFLLAVHSRFFGKQIQRWGLLGGGIEWGEAPEAAVKRELREEIELDLEHVQHLGDYEYKRGRHAVYAARTEVGRFDYDSRELVDIAWFTSEEVRELHRDQRLHAGYELDAIERTLDLSSNKLWLAS